VHSDSFSLIAHGINITIQKWQHKSGSTKGGNSVHDKAFKKRHIAAAASASVSRQDTEVSVHQGQPHEHFHGLVRGLWYTLFELVVRNSVFSGRGGGF